MAEIESKKPQQNYYNYKLHLKSTTAFFLCVCVLSGNRGNKIKHMLEWNNSTNKQELKECPGTENGQSENKNETPL